MSQPRLTYPAPLETGRDRENYYNESYQVEGLPESYPVFSYFLAELSRGPFRLNSGEIAGFISDLRMRFKKLEDAKEGIPFWHTIIGYVDNSNTLEDGTVKRISEYVQTNVKQNVEKVEAKAQEIRFKTTQNRNEYIKKNKEAALKKLINEIDLHDYFNEKEKIDSAQYGFVVIRVLEVLIERTTNSDFIFVYRELKDRYQKALFDNDIRAFFSNGQLIKRKVNERGEEVEKEIFVCNFIYVIRESLIRESKKIQKEIKSVLDADKNANTLELDTLASLRLFADAAVRLAKFEGDTNPEHSNTYYSKNEAAEYKREAFSYFKREFLAIVEEVFNEHNFALNRIRKGLPTVVDEKVAIIKHMPHEQKVQDPEELIPVEETPTIFQRIKNGLASFMEEYPRGSRILIAGMVLVVISALVIGITIATGGVGAIVGVAALALTGMQLPGAAAALTAVAASSALFAGLIDAALVVGISSLVFSATATLIGIFGGKKEKPTNEPLDNSRSSEEHSGSRTARTSSHSSSDGAKADLSQQQAFVRSPSASSLPSQAHKRKPSIERSQSEPDLMALKRESMFANRNGSEAAEQSASESHSANASHADSDSDDQRSDSKPKKI